MNISKIQLRNSGLKGIVVTHLTTETRDDGEHNVESVDTHKAPIHTALRTAMTKLGKFAETMLELRDGTNCTVLGVQGDNEKCRFNVEVDTDYGMSYNVWTPWVSEGVYGRHFDKLSVLVSKVYDEVHSYCVNKVTASAKQIVMDFAKLEKKEKLRNAAIEFSEAIGDKSEKEILEAARKLCEGHGDFILSKDEEKAVEANDGESEAAQEF